MRSIIAVGLCFALAACSHTSSSDGGGNGEPIATADMEISVNVSATDDASVRVSARVDDGHFAGEVYVLTGGDRFDACVVEQCKQLTKDFGDKLLGDYYDQSMPFVADQPYVVSLTRPTATSAPASFVTLPAAFAIVTPAVEQHYTDGESISVAWQPATVDRTQISAFGQCDHTDGVHSSTVPISAIDADGDGTAVLAINDLFLYFDDFRDSTAPIERCLFEVTIEKQRNGTIDPAFDGGHITGNVARTRTVIYVPSPH